MTDMIKKLVFGLPRRGERVINQAPTVTTINPPSTPSFNEWAQQLKVSSRYVKFRK